MSESFEQDLAEGGDELTPVQALIKDRLDELEQEEQKALERGEVHLAKEIATELAALIVEVGMIAKALGIACAIQHGDFEVVEVSKDALRTLDQKLGRRTEIVDDGDDTIFY